MNNDDTIKKAQEVADEVAELILHHIARANRVLDEDKDPPMTVNRSTAFKPLLEAYTSLIQALR